MPFKLFTHCVQFFTKTVLNIKFMAQQREQPMTKTHLSVFAFSFFEGVTESDWRVYHDSTFTAVSSKISDRWMPTQCCHTDVSS